MKIADYVVTEAGFGADLGAEKFLISSAVRHTEARCGCFGCNRARAEI